ncbi:dNTP triphosphohydrolase [Cytophagaceae bacterium ABcell3]|nr:dNTP triphosphohydrolase [Cytophagaceae bacterium ABcell3]
MNWTNIISEKRSETDPKYTGPRSEYQIDFDRLIFSSGFRRLQNKTQVFPLPGSTFVHNRLTHSLEVASVGRSLGKIVGSQIAAKHPELPEETTHFYNYELSNVVAAACLAHDIGNPAFGHSGEKAISNYFKEYKSEVIEGVALKDYFNAKEWSDFQNFEGNANAIRILTHQFNGKSEGGMKLTYATLAAILKYPCESVAYDKNLKHRKKYGFFQSEKDTVLRICKSLNMLEESADPTSYKRHPFVYLTEAADDICYRVIDLEDAQRLGILPSVEAEGLLAMLLESLGENMDKVNNTLNRISDKNERISYLRARSINALITQTVEIFSQYSDEIITGTYNDTLIDALQDRCPALQEILKVSVDKIYNHDSVIEIEIAGYNVMSDILSMMVPAVLKQSPSHKDKKVLRLLPEQFLFSKEATAYERVLSVLDFVSGMTDSYATELYRKVFGIEIPKHG